ncbi:Transcriptional regulatory protein PrrA [Pararobbsia alpina]|uniref:response regulator transcription factor n=1 Tax=Pararobbsia alpina TaxID=621374 RepID=UPI0039A47C3D
MESQLPAPSVAGRKPRILIVEDDDRVRVEIAAALEDHGFIVECTADGHTGLIQALGEQHDAIVLDRMLPDIDGLSILATLRNVGKQTPVLILSALSAVDERIRGLRAGGDDYVVKPVDSLELSARLNALLRRRLTSHTATICVGDLVLDTEQRDVRRGGEVIDLKPREYSLLEFLARHAGQVVTRAMLLESVWNYHFDSRSNVIDMHIGQLRRKISFNGRLSVMIQTVRNVGYVLHATE